LSEQMREVSLKKKPPDVCLSRCSGKFSVSVFKYIIRWRRIMCELPSVQVMKIGIVNKNGCSVSKAVCEAALLNIRTVIPGYLGAVEVFCREDPRGNQAFVGKNFSITEDTLVCDLTIFDNDAGRHLQALMDHIKKGEIVFGCNLLVNKGDDGNIEGMTIVSLSALNKKDKA